MDYTERCKKERASILARLEVRYSRQPSKRQEQWDEKGGRMPMDMADALEQRREELAFEEFGQTWNRRDGWQP